MRGANGMVTIAVAVIAQSRNAVTLCANHGMAYVQRIGHSWGSIVVMITQTMGVSFAQRHNVVNPHASLILPASVAIINLLRKWETMSIAILGSAKAWSVVRTSQPMTIVGTTKEMAWPWAGVILGRTRRITTGLAPSARKHGQGGTTIIRRIPKTSTVRAIAAKERAGSPVGAIPATRPLESRIIALPAAEQEERMILTTAAVATVPRPTAAFRLAGQAAGETT